MKAIVIKLSTLILLASFIQRCKPCSCLAGTYCDASCVTLGNCDNGWYNPGGGTLTCSVCPAGSYCPMKSSVVACPKELPFSYFGGGTCLQCPAGYACTPGSAATVCAEGTYSLAGDGVCSPCPAGYKCADRTQAPVACSAGYYSLGSTSYCTICLPGQYCPLTTATSLTCQAGTYSLYQATSCTTCPAGSYCPRVDMAPLVCLSGEYSTPGLTACIRCEAGKKCSVTTQPGVDCEAGYYSLGGQTACTQCPAGYICPSKNLAPTTLCSAGFYSLAGATQCQACPQGQLCQYTYQAASGACAANYYQPGGLGYCKMCEPGYECDGVNHKACGAGQYSLGMSSCTNCPAGKYCDTNTRQLDCPAGTYCPLNSFTYISCPKGYSCSSTSTAPAACASGTYSLGRQTACTPCPDGFYCPTTTDPPMLCPPGYYTTGASQTSCTQCPAGSYCFGTMSTQKSTSPTGSYSLAGMTFYVQCMPGYTCPSASGTPTLCTAGYWTDVGSTSATCTQCTAGKACPTTSKNDMYTCPTGTYSAAGATSCTLCPGGYSCTSTAATVCATGSFALPGAAACTQCPAGFYCPYTNAPHVFPCPPGTYSAAGQTSCTLCTAGTSCASRLSATACSGDSYSRHYAQPGSHQCSFCPAGSSCTGGLSTPCASGFYGPAGVDTCTECPAGSYCPTATSYPIPCPAGTYSAVQQFVCTACTLGQYSAEGATTCTNAPAGYYTPAPHIYPKVCPPGTYSLLGSASCTPCTPGYFCGVGSTTATANACPDGYYCNYVSVMGFGGIGKMPCPAGTYRATANNLGTSLADCLSCTAGSYCLEGTGTPVTCPAGHICPAKTKYPNQYPCPAGTFNSATGKSLTSDCGACTIGNYCPTGATSAIVCPPGYFCPAGTGYLTNALLTLPGGSSGLTSLSASGGATTCPEGYYCPVGTVFPIACPPGTYRTGTGAKMKSECLKCTAGKPCPLYANILADNGITCPAGYYCPEGTEYPTQYPCTPGTFSDTTGLTAESGCTQCPAGMACDGGTNSVTNPQKKCLPGYYCPAGSTNPKANPCPAGKIGNTYSMQLSTDCATTCDAGYYCLSGSDRVTGECPEGYFCPSGSTSPLTNPCPAGTFSNLRMLYDTSQCTTCPTGSYCPAASTAPLPCPGGTYNTLTGKGLVTDCLACDAGYSCSLNASAKIACGVGYYSPSSSTQCFACLVGYYCNVAATSDTVMIANVCGAGNYCPLGTSVYPSTTLACPAGYYCTAGTSAPMKCKPGEISSSGASACTSNTAGSYTVMGSGTATGGCSPGYYCPTGSWNSQAVACGAGTYCSTTTGSVPADCLACTQGYYCPVATGVPIICPQGYYCPPSSGSPTKCPAGRYGGNFGLIQQTDCTLCPAGRFCSQPGLSGPEGLCDAGYFCTSGATTSTPTDGTTGNVCDAGGYCDTGSTTASSCPPGRYNPTTGGRDLTACILCPLGKYCSGESQSSFTGVCSAGYYCPAGSYMSNMRPAAPGNFTAAGASVQVVCAEGTYNPFYAQSACLPCPAGFLCKGTSNAGTFINCPQGNFCPSNSILPTACGQGYYNPNYNGQSSADCIACPQGKYCSVQGLYQPGDGNPADDSDCDPGYFCKTLSNTKAPAALDASGNFGPCPVGKYCPKGISNPIPCPPGTYSAQTLLSSAGQCTQCTAGSYCSGGLSAPDGLCGAGYFCPLGSKVIKLAANECPVGFSCAQGSAAAVACSPGYYQDETGQATCKDCPPGYYCPQQTSSLTGLDCPKGFYCPQNTGTSTQNACPIGTYNPQKNAWQASQCILCDPGSYCAGTGLIAVTGSCNAGYYCTLGSPTAMPPSTQLGAPANHGNLCPVGSYCPAGSAMPILCPGGKYCAQTGLATNQGDCSAGYYCRLGSTSQTPNNLVLQGGAQCTTGHYCPAGSDSPTPCPPGYYSPNVGNTVSTNCFACPNGQYCLDAGAAAPTGQCSAGYFCKVTTGNAGYTTPTPASQICPIGYYCPIGTLDKMACITGFTDILGQASCTSCPSGYTCTTSSKTLCQPRLEMLSYYCPAGVMTKVTCPLGTYNMIDGTNSINECTKCPAGYYCPVSSSLAKIIPCQAGYYCQSTGNSVATGDGKCPAGNYCPLGSYAPIKCPAGKFCDTTGLTDSILTDVAKNCAAGYICYGQAVSSTPTDGTTGSICPAGFYCPTGTKMPIACPIGYFRMLMGGISSADCSACTAGNSCPRKALTSPVSSCPAGYYCPVQNSINLTNICPTGAYCAAGSSTYTVCADMTYQNAPGSANCLDCPARFYCANGNDKVQASAPRECPAGKYCPARTSVPISCPIGTFSQRLGLALDTECDSCTPGSYCQTLGITAPTGQCNAGYYCSGGAKVANPSDATGNLCTKGHYCPAGTAIPIPCPPGTYNDAQGKTQSNDCIACPSGYFCPLRGATSMDLSFGSSTYQCLGGYLCLTGATIPNPTDGTTGRRCTTGKYCPAGTTSEISCVAGTYNPTNGQSACLPCPAGKICATTGLATFISCTVGNYCPLGSSVPTACPAGTYNPFTDVESQDQCIDCLPGKYCVGGKSAPDGNCADGYVCPSKASVSFSYTLYSQAANTPGQCPPGYKCVAGCSAPVPCGIGEYNSQAGQTLCTACPAGMYCDQLGLTAAVKACLPGFYCISGAKHGQPLNAATDGGRLCNPGFYCPAGTTSEQACPAGTYEPRSGSYACQTCPAGYYCSGGTITPTGCPVGSYCPAGSSGPTVCPDGRYGLAGRDKLEADSQCNPCPSGSYCRMGIIQGPCNAGYYCYVGAASPNDNTKLCITGHYCLSGCKLPTRCPNGKFNLNVGSSSLSACVDCLSGFYCIAGSSTPILCPKGHYCIPPASFPNQCPQGTYQPLTNQIANTTCLPCPAGTYCYENATYDPTMYPCPLGKYCILANATAYTPIDCPFGTYRNTTGAEKFTDCTRCPGGYYCTNSTINPIPCRRGYYCDGLTYELVCPPGYYCPALSAGPVTCPQAYYCPRGSEMPIKCENGYYCPQSSANQTACPSGMVGSYNPFNINVTTGCTLCTPGYYSDLINNTLSCIACTPGYVCLGGTTMAQPVDVVTDKGQECPAGFYCPPGTYKPLVCPRGTFNAWTKGTSLESCKKCPDKMFSPDFAATECKYCGENSLPSADGTTCDCIGKYRSYQVQTSSCLCIPLYEPTSGSSAETSPLDCQPLIYDRCSQTQVRDANGKCKNANDCPECPGGRGTRSPGIGVCECLTIDLQANICNDSCIAKSLQLTITYSGAIAVADPSNPNANTSISRDSLPGLLGNITCPTTNCKIASISLKSGNGFSANYAPTSSINSAYKGTTTGKRLLSEGRVLQSTSDAGISNPIICLNLGDTMMFEVSAPSKYPVYDINNLINSNPNFDYSPFVLLAQKMAGNTNVTDFAYTFTQAGRYVFVNAANSAQITIIGVMASNEKCSDSTRFIQPITTTTLLQLGASQNSSIILTPDWGLVFGLIAAILFGTPLLIGLLKYLTQASWIRKKADRIPYRELNKETKYKKYTAKGKEWRREIYKGPEEPYLAVPQLGEQAKVLVSEDSELITKPSSRERQIIEMRKKENREGVHEISTDIFRDLYKELQFHAKFVKDEFAKKAGMDSENIKKVFSEIDRLKLLMQEKLQNIAKSYGRGIRLMFSENTDKEGIFVEEENLEAEENKKKEEEKKEESEDEAEKAEENVGFEEQIMEDLEQRDQARVDEFAGKLREDQAEMEAETDAKEKERKAKFLESIKGNKSLSQDEKNALIADYEKSNAKLKKLLMIEEQSSEDKLQQILDQRRKRRLQMQEEIGKLESKKKQIQEETELKQKDIEEQKQTIANAIDEEIKKEKGDEIEKLAKQKNEELINVRKKFQEKITADMTGTQRSALLEKFGNKMKILEKELEESRKKEQEELMMKLDMKRQSRRAEREAELKRRERELKDSQGAEISAINAKLVMLNENLKNEQTDEMIQKVQAEEQAKDEETGDATSLVLPKKIEENRAKETDLIITSEAKLEEEKKAIAEAEQNEIKEIEAERNSAEKKIHETISQVKNRKAELNGKLAKADKASEKKRLLEEYKQFEEQVADQVKNELVKQDATFEEKMAERKRKRAEKEAEIQNNQEKEIEALRKANRIEEAALAKAVEDQKLQRQIDKLKMLLTQDELPFAIERLVDEKQMKELSNLLRRQLRNKSEVLKSNMEKLLKLKAAAMDQAKRGIDAQQARAKQLVDQGLMKKTDYATKLEELKERKENAIKQVEYDFAQKQNELEEHKIMELEKENTDELLNLVKQHANEKQMYLHAYISDEFLRKILAGDKAKMDEEMADYEAELKRVYDQRAKEIEDKKKKIEEILLQNGDKIKELEAQAKKMLDDQELRDKKREEKKKKEMQEKLATKEAELSKQKGITEEERIKLLEEHQKELDMLTGVMEKERDRQRAVIKEKITEKLKQKEITKKQRDEQIALFQKEEEKLLNEQVKKIQKEKGIETEEEKDHINKLSKKYEHVKLLFEKIKPVAGAVLEQEKAEENVLKGILESKRKSIKEPNKIDLSFELLFDRLKKLESSVGTITGLQFQQILTGFLDLNNKIENISAGNIPRVPANKLEVVGDEPSPEEKEQNE